jgi:glycosyltransferase involved in cell wall biosynthesis
MNAVIVIPIYNEADSLSRLLDLIRDTSKSQIKFLLVDNGSSDEKVIQLLMSDSRCWDYIRTEKNLGFGGGILFGIKATQSTLVGWMPGNLKVDPREVASTFDCLELGEGEMFKSSRSGRTMSEYIKTWMAGLFQSIMLGVTMFDSGGTPTICTRKFVDSFNNPPTDYVFESFVLYRARKIGMRIKRPKIHYGKRSFGSSHWQRGLKSEIKLLYAIYKAARSWRLDA